jgi:anti-anti-sigma regulatory factor
MSEFGHQRCFAEYSGDEVMLRITTLNDAHSTTYKLEGELRGPWVKELEQCWLAKPQAPSAHRILVDLTSVGFIDSAGKALLHKMYEQGAELIAVNCLTKFIVDEITKPETEPHPTHQGQTYEKQKVDC